MSFHALGFDTKILQAIKDAGYVTPTPIQAEAIPVAMAGQDIIGIAQTGTGKTAAFTLPILHHLSQLIKDGALSGIKVLIIAPTRELVVQIEDNIKGYAKYLPIKSVAIYGGVSERPQASALRHGVHIVVATPGRMLDLMNQKHGDFTALDVLVLDEADRMLDMGFLPDIKTIIKSLPRKRQTLMFSATLSKEIEGLTHEFQHQPKTVQIGKRANPADTISQFIYEVPRHLKNSLLLHLIIQPTFKTVLVFARTRHGVERVGRFLKEYGVKTATLHSDRSQNQRIRALKDFKAGLFQVLVATDVAARGIDVEDITQVVNFDFPANPEDYVHRIGRTGRAQANGDALSFVTPEDRNQLSNLESFIGKSLVRKKALGFDYNGPPSLSSEEEERIDDRRKLGPRNHRQEPTQKQNIPPTHRKVQFVTGTQTTKRNRIITSKVNHKLEEGTLGRAESKGPKKWIPSEKTMPISKTKNSERERSIGKKHVAPVKPPSGFWSKAPHNKGGSSKGKKR